MVGNFLEMALLTSFYNYNSAVLLIQSSGCACDHCLISSGLHAFTQVIVAQVHRASCKLAVALSRCGVQHKRAQQYKVGRGGRSMHKIYDVQHNHSE